MLSTKSKLFIFTLTIIILSTMTIYSSVHPSYSKKVVIDTMPFYPDAVYDKTTPRPNDYFTNKIGEWPVRYYEIEPYLNRVAISSSRVIVETYGQTHEGRDLFNVIISSEANIERIESIRADLNKISNPEKISNIQELHKITKTLPASAWLGYCIHGDEISGVDAAMQLIYHLVAAQDSTTLHLLDNVVIIIDPTQNPDGRERYLSMLQTYKSFMPNYDRHAMQHQGVWPWGRGNHYLFDLNRDWILNVQPKTKGGLQIFLRGNPHLVIDAHEMGSSDNYLFTPPREPINFNTPSNVKKWWNLFHKDQASAFDIRGWPYYIGEWHEQWYPGYGSAWATFTGTVGILYEQAGVDGMFVKQPNNYILTYHEAVNHQFTSSITNLFTTANNRENLLNDYYQTRKKIVNQGKSSGLQFLFKPDKDEIKMKRFIENLTTQGIKVAKATGSFIVTNAINIFNEKQSSVKFPEGTYIVNTAQPSGALAKAVLEFDPRLSYEFLKEERRELEKYDESKMYEVSSWSLPLAYNIDAYWTTSKFKVNSDEITKVQLSSGLLNNPDADFAWVIDMLGEKTYKVLNRLFLENLIIYASEKEFTIENIKYNAGSLVIRRRGNPPNTAEILNEIAEQFGMDINGVNTGQSSSGSFLGAPTFRMLKQPKLAILTGEPLGITSFGSLWNAIDFELEIPHSLLRISSLAHANLDKYNILIVPSAWGSLSNELTGYVKEKISGWIRNGGTLICVGNATFWAVDSATGLSQARARRDVLEKLADYGKALEREKRAESPPLDTIALWYPEKIEKEKVKDEKPSFPPKKELEDIDRWQRKFAPQGAILKVNLDNEDWMTFGLSKSIPAIFGGSRVLMAKSPVSIPARFADNVNIRISGLLWPEARERIAESVFATHESKGKGQIILFSQDPNFRGYFYGTRAMFVNAILYGPGFGSRASGPYQQDEK